MQKCDRISRRDGFDSPQGQPPLRRRHSSTILVLGWVLAALLPLAVTAVRPVLAVQISRVGLCEGSSLGCDGADFKIQGNDKSDFGTSIAMGYLNGDNFVDLVVGAPREGRVYIFFGAVDKATSNPTWPGQEVSDRKVDATVVNQGSIHTSNADIVIQEETDDPKSAKSLFGFSVAIGHSHDGTDKKNVLIIGAPNALTGRSTNLEPGSAYAFDLSALRHVVKGKVDSHFQYFMKEQDQGVLKLTGAIREQAGYAVALGRVDDSDQIDDVVVSAPRAGKDQRGNKDQRGVVYVVNGTKIPSDSQTTVEILLSTAPSSDVQRIAGALPSEGLGESFAIADFLGTGAHQLAVGAVGIPSRKGTNIKGRVYVVDVSAAAMGTLDLSAQNSNVRIVEGKEKNDFFGFAMTSGDFNGDGKADLAAGAIYADRATFVNAGAAYVFTTVAALHTSNNPDPINPADGAEKTILGDKRWDEFGFSLAAGNVDHKGSIDLIVGARWQDRDISKADEVNAGAVYVFYGDNFANWPPSVECKDTGGKCAANPDHVDAMIVGGTRDSKTDSDEVGYALAAGDFNGNSVFDDIAVSSLAHNRVYLVSLENTDDPGGPPIPGQRTDSFRDIRDQDDDGDGDPSGSTTRRLWDVNEDVNEDGILDPTESDPLVPNRDLQVSANIEATAPADETAADVTCGKNFKLKVRVHNASPALNVLNPVLTIDFPDAAIPEFDYNGTASYVVRNGGAPVDVDVSSLFTAAGSDCSTTAGKLCRRVTLNVDLAADVGGVGSGTDELELSFGISARAATVGRNETGAGGRIRTVLDDALDELPSGQPNSDSIAARMICPDLSLVKLGPAIGDAIVGEDRTYTLMLTNHTAPGQPGASAEGVVLTDMLPAGITYKSSTPAGTFNSGSKTVTWTVGSVADNTINSTYTITFTIDSETTLTNSAAVTTTSGQRIVGPPPAGNDSASYTVTSTQPNLVVTKTTCPTDAFVGETRDFTFNLKNTGTATAKNTKLVATLPAGVTLDVIDPTSPTGAVFDPVARTVTWTVGDAIVGFNSDFRVKVRIDATGSLTVTAMAMTTNAQSTTADDTASCTVTSTQPNLVVVKTCPADAFVGENRDFTINLQNTGNAAAKNTVLTDTLPPGVTYVSSTPPGGVFNAGARTVTWTLGSVAAGTNDNYVVTVRVDATGTLANTALATTTSQQPLTTDDTFTCSVTGTQADLLVSKSCPADAFVGENRDYTINLQNTGTGPAKTTVLVDTLPAGVTYVGSTPPGGVFNAGARTVTWSLGTVPPGFNQPFTVTVTITAEGTLTNTAAVTTSSTQVSTADNTSSCSVTGTEANLVVAKSCPADAFVGENRTYTINLKNTGTGPAKGSVLTDTLPAGVTYVSSIPAGVFNGGARTVTWTLGPLPPSSNQDFTITVTIDAIGVLTNSATATTTSTQTSLADDTSSCSVTATQPNLVVTKSCPPDAIVGENRDYVVRLRNTGTSPANSSVLTDTLPAGVTYLSSSPAGAFDGPTRTVTWILGALPGGYDQNFTITVRIEAPGSLVNNAAATTTSAQSSTADDAASCSVTGTVANVAVSTTCPPDAIVGENRTFMVNLRNTGTATANATVLVDKLPVGVTYISSSPLGSFDGLTGTVTWNNLGGAGNGNLPPGFNQDLTVTVRIDAAGTLTNMATATTTSAQSSTGDDASSCSVPGQQPNLVVSKSCPADAVVGTNRNFTVNLQNTGTSAANATVLTDTLPAGVTYQSSNPAGVFNGALRTVTWNLGTVALGYNQDFTVTVMIDSAISLTNSASVTTTSVQSNTSDDASNCTVAGTIANLVVGKTCPSDAIAGENRDYVVRLRNTGTAAADNVVLSDTLPAGVTYVSSIPTGTLTGNTVSWTVGTAPAGYDQNYTVTVTINSTGTLTNSATATTTSSQSTTADDSASCDVTGVQANLVVVKSCPPDAIVGEMRNFVVNLQNPGTGPAKNTVLVDTLPAGVTFVSSAPPGGVFNAGDRTITWSLGTVPPGYNQDFTVGVTIVSAVSLTNDAAITTTTQQSSTADDTSSCTVAGTQSNLVVAKTCPPDAFKGENRDFTLNLRNTGTGAAKNVVLTDDLPAGVLYVSSNPPGAFDPANNRVTWTLGTVPAAFNQNFVVKATIETFGVLTNMGSVATTSDQTISADDTSSCGVMAHDLNLVVAKTCPADAIAGENRDYMVNLQNVGDLAASNVVLKDTLPAGVTYLSSTPPGAVFDALANTVTWNVGLAAAGFNQNYTISVMINAVGTLSNTASVTTSDAQSSTADDSSTCTVLSTIANLVVTKSCPADAPLGENRLYTVNLKNVGSLAAANVVLTDTLPAGVTYVSSTPAGVFDAGTGTVTWNVGTALAGFNQDYTITVTIDVVGLLHNTASTSTTSTESTTADNSSSCDVVGVQSNLVVIKTCPADAVVGEDRDYTVRLQNTGTGPAKNVVLTDTLPAGVIYVSSNPAGTFDSGTNTVTWTIGTTVAAFDQPFTITVTINAIGDLTNAAAVTTTSLQTSTADDSATCPLTGTQSNLVVTKTCPADAVVGENRDYTVRLQNTGTGPARNVVLTDSLPAGVAYVSSSPVGTFDSGTNTVTWTIGTADAAFDQPFTITVTINAIGDLINAAAVTTSSLQTSTADDSSTCPVTATGPNLVVTKTCPADAVVGENRDYTVRLQNTGNDSAQNVVLTDTLPAGITYVSSNPAGTFDSGTNTVTWTIGTADAAFDQPFTITVTTDAAGDLTNAAAVTTTSVQTRTADDSATCPLTGTQSNLVVTKTCPADAVVGENRDYTVRLQNTGTGPARNVVLIDTLPVGVTYVSDDAAGTFDSGTNTVTWTIGTADAAFDLPFTITVTIDAIGDLTNAAAVTTSSVQTSTADDSATCPLTGTQSNLVVTKTCPADAVVGENRDYTVRLQNTGTGPARDVVLIDALPAGVTYVSDDAAGNFDSGNNTVTWTIGTADAAFDQPFTITVTINAIGDLINTAAVTSSSLQTSSADDSSMCTVTGTTVAAKVRGLEPQNLLGRDTRGNTRPSPNPFR